MTAAVKQQTITRLLDSDAGKAMAAEVEAQRLVERRTHVEAIKALREREATEIPPLREAVKKTDVARFKVADALKKANRVYDTARSAHDGAAASLTAAITMQEGALRTSADPSIDAFIVELRDLRDHMRRTGWDRIKVETNRIDSFANRIFKHVTNREAFLRRIDAIHFEAIPAAEALRLEALTADELATRIAKMRDGLPIVTPPIDEAPDVNN